MQFTAWQKDGVSRPSAQACRVCDSKCGLPVFGSAAIAKANADDPKEGCRVLPATRPCLQGLVCYTSPPNDLRSAARPFGAGGGSRGGKSARVGGCRKADADVGAFHFGGAGIWGAPSVSSN
jgi:hypothetical protein